MRDDQGTEPPQCDYRKQLVAVDHKADKVYEGVVWCDLGDNPCMWEYEKECDEYADFLKEWAENEAT